MNHLLPFRPGAGRGEASQIRELTHRRFSAIMSHADWMYGEVRKWAKGPHFTECALNLAVSSAGNPCCTRVFVSSDFKISYCSCVFFLRFLCARKTVKIYGELSEWSKVQHSKSPNRLCVSYRTKPVTVRLFTGSKTEYSVVLSVSSFRRGF